MASPWLTFECRAASRIFDGVELASREARCTRDEPGRRRGSDHDMRAM